VNRETTVDRHEVQRLRYVPGQDLLAEDFRDLLAFQAQLGAWHNRALHDAYGVRYGLRVTLAAGGARVTSGIAYDAYGRVLLLARPQVVALPAPATGDALLLVIHVPPGAERACTDRGLDLTAALLSWRPERRWRSGGGVALARLVPSEGAFVLDPDFDPPLTRPLAKPRIAAGSTVSGGTAWQLWLLADQRATPWGIQVAVDTRASGFTRTPCYFAWMRGTLEFQHAQVGSPQTLLVPLRVSLSAENTAGFRILIPLQPGVDAGVDLGPLLTSARERLSVGWLGIQEDLRTFPFLEVPHEHP
jgi:hypothetical protein